ncbi:MAG: HNH endonuclease [Firmicutes bacterium]|nr:HNH endonuclease [Bacillota bacterium]
MSVHVLLDEIFFATSWPVGDQQRVLLLPTNRGLHVGDTVFLRNDDGELTWVCDVLATGEVDGTGAWNGEDQPPRQRHALLGYLARIHPGVVPRGSSRLVARWVTLNRRTVQSALPWWEKGLLVYHSTLRLIEGVLSPEHVHKAAELGYLNRHPSGHWVIPHGEARKRILVHVLGADLTCGLCGGPISAVEEATQDHVIPVSQGGPDALANVQLAHRSCNELKGNALPEQYPPFFPRPGDEVARWYDRAARRARGGRNGRNHRTRLVPAAAFQVQPRDVPLAVLAPASRPSQAAASSHPEPGEPEPDNLALPAFGSGEPPERADHKPAVAGGQEESAPGAGEQEWLTTVREACLKDLMALSREPNWAARTATLRTLEQLPRSRATLAKEQGTLLAEAQGPKGRFQLLEWQGEHVLVEERGRRQALHLVKMIYALSPRAYVWYLSRFGRTSPLAVAMALSPLWQKGTPDEHGRMQVKKSGIQFVLVVQDERVTDCVEELSLAAS